MSDTVSRKALLKFLYANYEENKLSQAGKALDYVIKKLESGAFPSTESDGEIESLKAITELAVKGLKSISNAYDRELEYCVNAADAALDEIAKLSHE